MSAVSFYKGAVSHRRFTKPSHGFRYSIAYILLDLDRLDDAGDASMFLGVGRSGIMSFLEKDHGDGSANSLAEWVRLQVRSSGAKDECAKILILTLPRMFGYVFNPISAYFIYDQAGKLHHILYEVNNTFGGRQTYLCSLSEASPVMTHECRKELYVSPFFEVEGDYKFSIFPPEDVTALTIDYHNAAGERVLNAHFQGKRWPVTNWQSLKILALYPFMTLGVVFAIHWEAFKLFLKGARYRSEKAAHEVKKTSLENSNALETVPHTSSKAA
jgi:DUF1365 family protein